MLSRGKEFKPAQIYKTDNKQKGVPTRTCQDTFLLLEGYSKSILLEDFPVFGVSIIAGVSDV